MATNLLIQNMAELFSVSSIMKGGRSDNMNSYMSKQNNFLVSILMILLLILIKGCIIFLLYNFLVPKIIYSLSENRSLEIIESNFKTLSFSESILLVIFTNTLFSIL